MPDLIERQRIRVARVAIEEVVRERLDRHEELFRSPEEKDVGVNREDMARARQQEEIPKLERRDILSPVSQRSEEPADLELALDARVCFPAADDRSLREVALELLHVRVVEATIVDEKGVIDAGKEVEAFERPHGV